MSKSQTAGKTLRLSRLFRKTGKSVILAMDHGKSRGMIAGLRDMGHTLRWAFEVGTDAVLINPGMFRHYAHLWQDRQAPGVILALDTHIAGSLPGVSHDRQSYRLLSTLEEAVALGADAVKVLLVFGRRDLEVHADNLKAVAEVVRESERLGLPVMIEPTLWGDGVSEAQKHDAALVEHICRIAVELGADLLKAPYAAGIYRELCRVLPVPITILGGEKVTDLNHLYRQVEQSVIEGIRGLAFGRNVWQQDDPVSVWRTLNAIVHEGRRTAAIGA